MPRQSIPLRRRGTIRNGVPRSALLVLMLIGSCARWTVAEERETKETPLPKVVMTLPIVMVQGGEGAIVLRGLLLDEATEVRTDIEGARVKLLVAGKAEVPERMDAGRVGDTQVEVEIAAPAVASLAELTLTVVTPKGDATIRLPIVSSVDTRTESEPNGGFSQAEVVPLGGTVLGVVSPAKDVDVFRIELIAGQRVTCRILAAAHGSPLDGSLTVYDAAGRIVTENDDQPDSRDSFADFTAGHAGTFYIALCDANDRGGALCAYALSIAGAD